MIIGMGIGVSDKGYAEVDKIIVYDSFDRANSNKLGISDTGQTWQELSGSWGIIDNQAYLPSGGSNSRAAIESNVSDGQISVEQTTTAPGSRILFRLTDITNHFSFQSESNHFRLYRFDSSGTNLLGSNNTVIPKNNDVLKVILKDNSIKCYVNNELIFSVTDNFNKAATRHGLMANGTTARFDNFKVEAV
ncbi:hypothetical protein [Niallia circulans]|uniref:hypothetical protein n=1 Tax=Niallia circulans TaxID=1397 RepID=UPI001561559E|nr:hypothetical protein [Niallia circulans]NRG30707.1 hypothetical protein [Niallia circulans]